MIKSTTEIDDQAHQFQTSVEMQNDYCHIGGTEYEINFKMFVAHNLGTQLFFTMQQITYQFMIYISVVRKPNSPPIAQKQLK